MESTGVGQPEPVREESACGAQPHNQRGRGESKVCMHSNKKLFLPRGGSSYNRGISEGAVLDTVNRYYGVRRRGEFTKKCTNIRHKFQCMANIDQIKYFLLLFVLFIYTFGVAG